jgi:hypothetical protein
LVGGEKIRPDVGIEARYPGFRLNGSVHEDYDWRASGEMSIEGPIIDDVELVIHTAREDQEEEEEEEEGHYPWRRSWQNIKFSDALLPPSLDLRSTHMYLRYHMDGWAELDRSGEIEEYGDHRGK